MDDITARQRRILEFIRKTVHDRGYPPTVREIGEAVGLTSSSAFSKRLRASSTSIKRGGTLSVRKSWRRTLTSSCASLRRSWRSAGSGSFSLVGSFAAGNFAWAPSPGNGPGAKRRSAETRAAKAGFPHHAGQSHVVAQAPRAFHHRPASRPPDPVAQGRPTAYRTREPGARPPSDPGADGLRLVVSPRV